MSEERIRALEAENARLRAGAGAAGDRGVPARNRRPGGRERTPEASGGGSHPRPAGVGVSGAAGRAPPVPGQQGKFPPFPPPPPPA